jgi:hypothetical protein
MNAGHGLTCYGPMLATLMLAALMLAALVLGMGPMEARGDLLVPGRRPPLPRPQPRTEPAGEAVEATGIRAPVRILRGPDNVPRQVKCRIMIPRKTLENLLKSGDGAMAAPSDVIVSGGPRMAAPFMGTVIAALLLAAAAALAPFVWRRRMVVGKRGWTAGTAGVLLLTGGIAWAFSSWGGGTPALADIALPPGERQQLIQLEVTDAGDRVTLFLRR